MLYREYLSMTDKDMIWPCRIENISILSTLHYTFFHHSAKNSLNTGFLCNLFFRGQQRNAYQVLYNTYTLSVQGHTRSVQSKFCVLLRCFRSAYTLYASFKRLAGHKIYLCMTL